MSVMRWILTSVLALSMMAGVFGVACSGAQKREDTKVIERPDEDGWRLLRQGDLTAAKKVFSQLAAVPGARAEGIAGLLRVAEIQGDSQAIAGLLDKAEEAPRTALLDIVAAQASSQSSARSKVQWLQRACTHLEDEKFEHDARSICARLVWHEATPKGTQCAEGCEDVQQVSMGLIGSLPVVMVSVNELEETPFIVDTGASTCVVARQYAEEHQLEGIEGAAYEARSAAGEVEAELTALSLQVADLRHDNVACSILEFPVEGIAGIISPQSDFEDFVVTMDFREMTMELAPPEKASPIEGVIDLPLLVDQGVLQIMAAVGDRPARPLLLDTGADHSRLHVDLHDKGTKLERGEEGVALAAGGEVRSWSTKGRLVASSQDLSWEMVNPALYEAEPSLSRGRMHWQGYMAMDVLLGRVLRVNTSQQSIAISSDSQLSPWSEGSSQTIEVRGVRWPEPVRITETVADHDGEQVTLAVTVEAEQEPTEFVIRFADDWASRESWLVTRPVTAYWQVEEEEKVEGDPAEAVQEYLPHFLPFEMTGTPNVKIEELSLPDGDHLCSRIESPAVAILDEPLEAVFSMWQCNRPWRTAKIELRSAEEDELLWGFAVVE